MYRLGMKCQLEIGEQLEEWVMAEFLPTIHQYGMYATAPTLDKMLDDPDFAIGLFGKLKEERQQKALLVQEKQLAITEHDKGNGNGVKLNYIVRKNNQIYN